MPATKKMQVTDKRYKVINSNHTERRGVAILYRSRFHATPLLSEYTDGHMLVVKLNARPDNLIVIALYIPPNYDEHKVIWTRFINVVTYLRQHYRTFSLLVYTDFNKDLRKSTSTKYTEALRKLGLTVHFSSDPSAYTRSEMKGAHLSTSYIDYFFSLNASTQNFRISHSVGLSDHRLLKIEVVATQPVTISTETKINYKKIRKGAPYIIDRIINFDNSTNENSLLSLTKLVTELRSQCPKQRITPKSLFMEIEEVEKEILKEKPNFDHINRLLVQSGRSNYYRFLDLLEKLRLEGNAKDYYAKLAYLQRSDCTYPFIEVLQDPTGGEDIIVDQSTIKSLLSDKYSKLFSRGTSKVNYLTQSTDDFPSFSSAEIWHALHNVSTGKAISHDLIPDAILAARDNDGFVNSLTYLINSMIQSKQIPKFIATGRLFILNKKPDKTPTMDSLRPINILSVVLKVLEAAILSHLKEFLRTKQYLHTAQLGFRAQLSTSMNILKFIGTCRDIRENKNKDAYVLFIDLKAAFDSVDHEILFQKLAIDGLDSKMLNLLKLLYSSIYTSIDYDETEPIPINQGVLQGSLISPYLFNIYINDLLADLEAHGITTLAYADDIACVCSTKALLEKAIARIERWCKSNKIALNASKSGYFKILGKRSKNVPPHEDIRGIPKVQSYKYLGITIGCDLRLNEHVTALRERCKKSINLFGKLIGSRISCKTRIEIWQTFTKSFLLYGLETAPLDKGRWTAIERLYLKTLKQAVHCPITVSTSLLLYVTDQWSPRMLMTFRILAFRRRYSEHFSEDFPRSITTWLATLATEYGFNLSDISSLTKPDIKKVLWAVDRRRLLNDIGGNHITSINTKTHNLLQVGDKRDDFIVKYFVGISGAMGHFRLKRLSIANCKECNVPGTQMHFVNDCPLFNTERQCLRMQLTNILGELNLNINLELNNLHSFIKFYLCDGRLARKMFFIHSYVKDYLFKVALDVYVFLKSLTDHQI